MLLDRKSTRLNSSHLVISYAVFCLKKKKKTFTFLLLRCPQNITSLAASTPAAVLGSRDPRSNRVLLVAAVLVFFFFFFFFLRRRPPPNSPLSPPPPFFK